MDEFSKFYETAKHKTDLTVWMIRIKNSPKDEFLYVKLADYLMEKGGLDNDVGKFLQECLEFQKRSFKGERTQENRDEEYRLRLFGEQIESKFKKLGIYSTASEPFHRYGNTVVPKRLTRSQTTFDDKRFSADLTSTSAIQKMTLSVMQPQGKGYPDAVQNNALSFLDIADRNVHLFLIFQMAQMIAVGILFFPENGDCVRELEDLLQYGFIRRNQYEEPEAINIDAILDCMSKSYECCEKIHWESILHIISLEHDIIQNSMDDTGLINDDIGMSLLQQWIDAIIEIDKNKTGCNEYRKTISSLVRQHRRYRQNKWRRR